MADVGRKAREYEAEDSERRPNQAISRLAGGQHGMVAVRQLAELGLGPSGARARAAEGKFHRIHRGVYAVGHPTPTREGWMMAAVLACGLRAVLSHRSAAALLGLRQTTRASVDVTIPRNSRRRHDGIDVHRSDLAASEITLIDGIRCTTVARTLLDLAELLPAREVERAAEQAEVLDLFDLREVEQVLERAHGRHGTPVLRSALAALRAGETLTKEELEERFLDLCRKAGFPPPMVNGWVDPDDGGAPIEVDFMWPDSRLAVDVHSFRYHRTRAKFKRDREREQRLDLAGYDYMTPGWAEVKAATGLRKRLERRLAR